MTEAGGSASAPRYRADVVASLDDFLARCARLRHPGSLPFHSEAWLRAWYETLGTHDGRTPLLVAVQRRDAAGAHHDALLCPLVAQRRGVLSVVEFADATVVDYVAPMLAADWCGEASETEAARAVWTALRQALSGHDLFHLHKLLPQTLPEDGSRRNPLALALPTQACQMFGNQFHVDGTWDDWRQGLPKHQRKELERSWRVFHKFPASRFERYTDEDAAWPVFEELDRQQSQRMRALVGERYVLDRPQYRAFYRRALQLGLSDGSMVLTALKDGDQIVSAMLGPASPSRYVAVRQSLSADPTWKACSPGRLIDEQTARVMHEAGVRHLDFGIGDYPHKDFFRFEHIELLDACVPLSWRGWPAVARWRTRRWLKRQAWALKLLRRLAPARGAPQA